MKEAQLLEILEQLGYFFDMRILKGNKMVCLNCGGEFVLELPLALGLFIKKMKAFEVLHKDCKEKPIKE